MATSDQDQDNAEQVDLPEPTARERAVQEALAKVADKRPRKATIVTADLPVSSGKDLGGTVPFLAKTLQSVLGTRTANGLKKLGLETVQDLLRHYPRRYGDRGTLTNIAELKLGEHVSVMAEVKTATIRRMKSREGAMMQVTVGDGYETLSLTFFAKREGVLRMHEMKLKPGTVALFTGVVSQYQQTRQLAHPEYLIVGVDTNDTDSARETVARPIPLYPATAGMTTMSIAVAVSTVIAQLRPEDVPDPVPEELATKHGLVTAFQALKDVHEPRTEADYRRGRRRLRYEEALVLQTALVQRREMYRQLKATQYPVPDGENILNKFNAQLPFELTQGQIQVGHELSADLAQSYPMQRLLQGDVGSGKTIVALRAMLQVVAAGGQAALLAPTEVLAAQHARSLAALLGDLAGAGMLGAGEHATHIALLTGSLGTAAKKQALLDAASGAAGIVIGTHALLSDHVQFADLGLVVVDEQHRFGVEQRDALRAKGGSVPHLLVMTATPIPRTVAMTVFGDLEISTLKELPQGRAGIDTFVVPADKQSWMLRTWQRAREEIDAGRQVYVVCSRISSDTDQEPAAQAPSLNQDADDKLFDYVEAPDPKRQLHAVEDVGEHLSAMATFAGVKIAVLHGKLAPGEKDAIMQDFASGATQLLVSTTVIEVGVDVRRASVMIILDADRFGLSQLHQLRGRVGRGNERGICLLVSPAEDGTDAKARLDALVKTTDGFELANTDLALRAEGDVLGASQSGRGTSLRLLRVVKDAKLIGVARKDAEDLVLSDPGLQNYPYLAQALTLRLEPERAKFLDRT